MATKPSPSPKPPNDPEQSKRFEEAARELEADESGEKFERAMDAVAPAPQPSDEGKRGKLKPRPAS